jgi:hypothetical protein
MSAPKRSFIFFIWLDLAVAFALFAAVPMLRLGALFYLMAALNLLLVIVVFRLFLRRLQLVSHPPGWGLRHFAELCFSKQTFLQILEPTLTDMQKEHFDALAEGALWKARMALLRGYWAFWSAVIAQLPISFARRVFEIWKTTKTGS